MKVKSEGLFSTPLVTVVWDDTEAFNSALKKAILKKRKETLGITRSNAARCWHSTNDLLQWDDPACRDLAERFKLAFVQMATLGYKMNPDKGKMNMTLQAWAMVSGAGDYANPHTHPNCHFSGVYYVGVGSNLNEHYRDNGHVEFIEPRGGINCMSVPQVQAFNPRAVYRPIPGAMLIFPAWLRHHVHPYHGDGERVAVACNARITKYSPSTK